MARITDEHELEAWLKVRPAAFACALAARAALRVAPVLGQALQEDTEDRRRALILPGFRALAAANFAGAWPRRMAEIRTAVRSARREVGSAAEAPARPAAPRGRDGPSRGRGSLPRPRPLPDWDAGRAVPEGGPAASPPSSTATASPTRFLKSRSMRGSKAPTSTSTTRDRAPRAAGRSTETPTGAVCCPRLRRICLCYAL